MKISYNWLKSYIPNLPNKEEISNLITFKICELEDIEETSNGDIVFDMKILPDRAHDLLSHRGVAKEIAGLLGINLEKASQNFHCESTNISLVGNFSARASRATQGSHNKNFVSLPSNLQIEVGSPLCKRYMGRIVRNIKVGPSPKWLVDYLESIGQRSINNVVDITNFILFDLGQPIHAFDLDKLASEKLIIRNAKVGESIELLGFENINGIQKRRNVLLSETNLVIADESGPVAIAGVKGGTKAEVDDNTKNILIEVANFDPISIRKTAKIFGIQTDAVKRYENGMTLNLCKDAMDEVSSLIYELCGDVIFEKIIDINNEKQSEKIVSFTTDYISKILGIEISNEEIENIFDNYNYRYTRNDNSWEFFVPDYRLDIDGGHDMAEEIGRAFGCERIIPKIPEFKSLIKDNEIWSKICIAKTKLINDGYREVMTYAFTNNGEVEIMASASDKNFLRTNLLDGLLKSYELNRLNMPFLGLSEIKIFEIGNVFKNNKEEIHIAYIDKKNKIEMTLDEFVKVDEQVLDNLNIELSENIKFKAWSIYPFITRDISVWVPQDTDPSLLANLYKELSVDLLVKDPELLDKFQKQDRISYSYRLVFQSYERTLKDEEVNQIMETITSKVKSLGFEPR